MVVKVLFSLNQNLYMKSLVILFSLLLTSIASAQTKEQIRLKKGRWVANLQLSEKDVLPFELEVKKLGKSVEISVINGDEIIKLDAPKVKNDSVHIRFPYFNSELVFHINSKKSIDGYWQNFNKGDHYTIDFSAEFNKKDPRFEEPKNINETINVDGRWKVAFEPGTNSEYPAVGIFEQNANVASGTFLTETGDYRFLAGNTFNDSLYLSCFDGSHAFLFKAKLDNNELKGQFFSGSHWKSNWSANRNENFELISPEDLTFILDKQQVDFRLKNLSGDSISFPNAQVDGKVVIIQIMGTWCPNCLDETMYYKNLNEKYKEQGLEIISVCYEAGDTYEEHVESIERLKNKLDLDFTFFVGGSAQKSLASDHFDMLNEVISFPTSIFIGRDGMVKRIHTGFNGPGTGEYYTEYIENTNALIEFLLAQ